MSNRKLRFALFGTGDFGPFFARYLTEIADVVAICDPKPEARKKFIETTGLKVAEYDDYERLLNEVEIDAVALTGPNHTHKPITLAAARRGKHVYCEKAMAPTVPDCWEMVGACEAANVRLMVGHKRRLRTPWARMIQLRDQVGPVVAITVIQYYDSRPYNFRGWWTREAESGGLLEVSGVHELDWMRAMCGDVEAVSGISGPQIDPRWEFSDSMHVLLRFRSGAIGIQGVSMVYPLLKFREACGGDVVCREGGMRLLTFLDHIDLYWQHQNDSQAHHERFDDLGFDHAFRLEIGDFVRWITDGTQPCLTWREGLRCVEVMEAAHRSAKQNGAWVKLPLYPELERP